jgi:hypothetical protein
MNKQRVDPKTIQPGERVTAINGALIVSGWIHSINVVGDGVTLYFEVERDADGHVLFAQGILLRRDAQVFASR